MTRTAPLRIAVAAAVLAALAPGAARAQADEAARVRAYVEANQHRIVDELIRLLSIPNVATNVADMRRNAALLQELMEARGIEVRLLETGGPPLVYGELRVPGATRTILFYCHYDGQPVDPAGWVGHAPFEPVLRAGPLATHPEIIPFPAADRPYEADWRIYARSASDDKSPIIGLLTALDALRDAGLAPRSNLKFLFEGDEEMGSPHLPRMLEAHRDLLRADVAIIADGPVHPSGRPTVTFGARGIATVELTVYGPKRPLHSGHYGNWAPNPAERLAALLATMKDADGRVRVEGWYDDVVPPGEAERRAIAALPSDDAERRALGIAEPHGAGLRRHEMLMRPSLNVRGLRAAYVGDQARTIIPDAATASLDLRLVTDVRPERQIQRLIDHVRAQGWHVVSEEPDDATRLAHARIVRVSGERGYPAVRTPLTHPAASALIGAVRATTDQEVVVIPTSGGSIPGYLFPEVLGAPYAALPIVNPDNNQHAENENLRLGNLFEGIVRLAAAMRMEFGTVP